MNARDHWAKRQKRKNAQQGEVLAEFYNALRGRKVEMPCIITLTRIGPRKLDGDNLQSSLKFCRDAIAWKFGVDDADGVAITWNYAQATGKYAVRVQIESLSHAHKETSP